MGRIVSGTAKGMRLTAPKGDATRPTSDRVKEALFSALATWFDAVDLPPAGQLAGLGVLDLYAGSGALGLEAASRGARRVVCVDHRTTPLIRANAKHCRLAVETLPAKVETALANLVGPFDMVFVDPPYDVAPETVERLLGTLATGGLLTEEALVVVERSRRTPDPMWPEPFARTWSRGYGETTLHFGVFETQEEA